MGRHATALGWALSAVGAVVAAIGAVLVIGPGSNGTAGTDAPRTVAAAATPSVTALPASTVAATSAPGTSAAATTTAPIPTTMVATTAPPTTVPVEAAVEEFFTSFTTALRSGDAGFLIGHLHPLVYDRYSNDACASQLGQLRLPDGGIGVVSVGPTGSWDWVTDGLTRTVDGVTTVATRTTSDGVTFTEAEAHVVVGDDGVVRWFTDCGDPKEGAT